MVNAFWGKNESLLDCAYWHLLARVYTSVSLGSYRNAAMLSVSLCPKIGQYWILAHLSVTKWNK